MMLLISRLSNLVFRIRFCPWSAYIVDVPNYANYALFISLHFIY